MSSQEMVPEFMPSASFVGKKDFPVKLQDKTIPEVRNERGARVTSTFTFPQEELFINHCRKFDNTICELDTTLPDFKRLTLYVPLDFPLRPLSENEKEAFAKKKKEQRFKEGLREYLGTSSFGFTIGTDPEIFVVHANGDLIPAYKFLGSKEKPSKTFSGLSHGSTECYWDGFQAEFTTQAPTCLAWLVDSIYCGLRGVLEHARKKFPDARLCLSPVMLVPQDLLDSAEEKYVEFGCQPSFNIYKLNPTLPSGRAVPFRSTGGHLHFGLGKLEHKDAARIVRALDAVLGVACVSLFQGIDDPRRRQYYGIPGEYRLPKHGLEYRPLSSAWLTHPFITHLIFDLARKIIKLGRTGHRKEIWQAEKQEIIDCMLYNDVEVAQNILARNKETFQRIVACAYSTLKYDSQETQAIYDLFYYGVHNYLKDPYDLEKNWNLTDNAWVPHAEKNVYNNLQNLIQHIKF